MRFESGNPQRGIQQGCVWAWHAPNPGTEVTFAAKRLRRMGSWKVGLGIKQEVLPLDEYRGHAQPGDYTQSMI